MAREISKHQLRFVFIVFATSVCFQPWPQEGAPWQAVPGAPVERKRKDWAQTQDWAAATALKAQRRAPYSVKHSPWSNGL